MPKDRHTKPDWLSEPTSFQTAPDIELWRVPKKGVLQGTIVSHDLTGRAIHYWLGRSGPCKGDDCEACRAGRAPREYFWIVALTRTTNQLFILELTDRAATPLARAWHKLRTLKGLVFEVGRTNKKENGPQRLRLIGEVTNKNELPVAPPLIPILNRIWQTAADPWKHPTPEQLARHERDINPAKPNAIDQQMGQQPTDGNERTGGPRPTHDLRVIAEEDRSLRQSATPRASNANPSPTAKPLPHGSNGMANLVPPYEGPLGGGQQAS